jgi:ATP-dependent DNA ligase
MPECRQAVEVDFGSQKALPIAPCQVRCRRFRAERFLVPKTNAPSAKEAASAVKVAKRVETEKKKAERFGELRYGFQLAETYSPSDFREGKMVAEVKYDGVLGMLIDGRIINRSGNDITNRFPEIESTDKAVLVGEIVVLCEDGTSDFHAIQERSTDDPLKVRMRSALNPATFVAFDILEDGVVGDLTDYPFRSRRATLEEFFGMTKLRNVKMAEQFAVKSDADIQKLVDVCREMETEGVMVKNLDARYVAKRGRNWLKAKTWQEATFEIIRYGDTGVGKGFTIFIKSGKHEQEVVMNSLEMQRKVKAGHKLVEIKFLSRSEDGAMRFPSVRRLVGKGEEI